MGDNKYVLYKRIMKHDVAAIDEIQSLEDAKELIKMIVVNTNLEHGINQIERELDLKFLNGDEKIAAVVIERFATNREVDIEPDEDVKGKHRCKLCGSFITEDNLEVCDKCASEYQL